MPWNKLRFNSRERLTASDLNRLHSLLGRDLADFFSYFFADKNQVTFAAGVSDGVVGGLNVTADPAAPTTTLTVEPGMLMQYDATAAIEPMSDPLLGENSPYRIGKLETGDTRTIVLGAPPAIGTPYTIQARFGYQDLENQSRDIWQNILSLFGASNVYKRRRPTITLSAKAGVPGSGVYPAPDAGYTLLAHAYTIVGLPAIQVTDLRKFLVPRTFGYPITGGGIDGTLHGTVAMQDSTNGFPGTTVGYIDGAGVVTGNRGYIMLSTSAGYYCVDLALGTAVAILEKDSTNAGHLQLKTSTGAIYLETDPTTGNLYLRGGGLIVQGAGGAPEYARADNSYGGRVAAGAGSYVNMTGNPRRHNVLGTAQNDGFAFGTASGTFYGGVVQTIAGDPSMFGFVRKFSFSNPGGAFPAIPQYGLVVYYNNGLGAYGVRLATKQPIIELGISGGGPPPAPLAYNLYLAGKVFGIALNAAAADGDPVYVLTHGYGRAIGDGAGYGGDEEICLSDTTDGQMVSSNPYVLNNFGYTLDVVIPGGPPHIYPVFFYGGARGY